MDTTGSMASGTNPGVVKGKPVVREVNTMMDPPKAHGLESVSRVRFLNGETTGTHNADRQTKIYLDAARQCVIFDRYSTATSDEPAKHITRKRYPMASVAFYVLDGEPLGDTVPGR